MQAAVDAYVAFFEGLAPSTLPGLARLCTPDVRFRDPFNDVRGVDRFQAALARMFRDVADPRFRVSDRALSGQTCYLRWTFTFRSRGRRAEPRRIEGVSELHLDPSGRVTAHIDHWDAAGGIYEHLPVVGAVLRTIRRRLAAAG